MNLTRRALLLGASAATAATLAACTGSSGKSGGDASKAAGSGSGKLSGEITFQTWSLKNEKFTPYFEALVKTFQEKNPGTTIKWIDQPGDGYEEKILQQANSGELPDVVNLPNDFAYQLAQVSQLVDLKATTPEVMSTYVPGGLASYTFDGIEGIFGYPWYLGTDVCWWNTDLLTQAGLDVANAPKTLDEYYSWVETAAAKGVKLVSYMPGVTDFKNSGVPIFKDGKFVFNTDAAAAIVDKFAAFYKNGAMPAEALNDDTADNAKMFTQEKAGYTTATSSFVSQLENDAPNVLKHVDCSARFETAPLFTQGISVAKGSKNMELALAFAQFVTNNENQVAFVKIARGFMPGTAEGNAHPESFSGDLNNELMKKAVGLAAAAMPKAEMSAPIQYSNDMKTYVQQQIALAIKGETTAKAALDAAVEYCNKALKA
ncbi:Cyclodextrin-binding protein precursor [Actinomyces bovis]|uniref:Cyclodextrin-binding protein n=1 Tax=Actinomyces bovis TaxID=1658 RepID=A0ABY1VNN0_9ACTO|nr:extracellular solute-binding protein [Actinomyces bovis]SPT53719.1 Cyclodextrin-binding protein precursor [Actinomyces bovis]VEG55869.1 Cyclodextrin-binding protein precursor [Actinomyces israelii]